MLREMIVKAAPATKVPAELKMLVRYPPTSGRFAAKTPESPVSTECRHQYADMVLRRNGNAAREAKQQKQQAAVRYATVDECADYGNRDRYPANDLEWIHCYPPDVVMDAALLTRCRCPRS